MNKEAKKDIKQRVQAHPDIGAVRTSLIEAVGKLPALDTKYDERMQTLSRCFIAGNLPKRVVSLLRGFYAVRPYVSGVSFSAAVFSSLGSRENHKLCATMTRLSDAIAYHFRASRMRSGSPYNLDVEQAKADAQSMHSELEALSKLLVSCGVVVMGNPISEIKWAASKECVDNADNAMSRIVVLEARVNTLFSLVNQHETDNENLRTVVNALQARITQLESKSGANVDAIAREVVERHIRPAGPILGDSGNGIPSAF